MAAIPVVKEQSRGTCVSVDLVAAYFADSFRQVVMQELTKHVVWIFSDIVIPNPLICQIGNYTLPDLHVRYRKYIHKRIKHLLL